MNISLRIEELKESCRRLASKEKDELEEKIKKEIDDQIYAEVEEYNSKQELAYQKKCARIRKRIL